MNVSAASEPGCEDARPSEDWHYASPHLTVVLDGATVRTDTGCVHGVPWYVDQLGARLVAILTATPRLSLTLALKRAIRAVGDLHPQCDLEHPGTPSAGVGVVVDRGSALRWLVLGDVTVAVDTGERVEVLVDDRVSRTAALARAEADRWPIGSAEKQAALQLMKQGELAARNTPGGYWIAAADPDAADHALQGTVTSWERLAVLTDGAARLQAFGVAEWAEGFKILDDAGPAGLIRAVRRAERTDPDGQRWPRNKRSDDATAVYATPTRVGYAVGDRVRSQWDGRLAGRVVEVRGQSNLLVRFGRSRVCVDMPHDELLRVVGHNEESPSPEVGEGLARVAADYRMLA